ncbi:MAG: hydantoinase/oxoprolinase family protein [Syntrophales bacterium]
MAMKGKCIIALDAGGTMTDTFLVDEQGSFTIGKSLTQPQDESISYMESVKDAASSWGLTSKEVHANGVSSTYTGTSMLNCIITRTGRTVGMLLTKGFEHMVFMNRGLTWLGMSFTDRMHVAVHDHPAPLMDRNNAKPVGGRIVGGTFFVGCHLEAGTEAIPLNEDDVVKGVNELLDAQVDVIGICFQCSYANPVHERRARDIALDLVKKRGMDIPVLISNDIAPRRGENMRFKSLLFQCYTAEKTRAALANVEAKAQADGYKFPLQTMLSYGAIVNIKYPKLYEALSSGPIGGLLGAKWLMCDQLDIKNVVAADLGGTSWDVGFMVKGTLSIKSESDFARHRLNVPVLNLDSVQGGTGLQLHIDEEFKRITLGPESAGNLVGTCYKYPEITIGDCDLILGYLNPEYFLGGKINLDKEYALQCLKERMADPLGMDVYDACEDVLELLHSKMADQVRDSLLSKGYYPRDYTLCCYGGSGPMHMWGVADKVKLAAVATVPWAAAFSAFGVATADYFHRYGNTVNVVWTRKMSDEFKIEQAKAMNTTWAELEERAYVDFENEGYSKDKVVMKYAVQARYVGQLDSWEVDSPVGRVNTVDDINSVINSFETLYQAIYPVGARFPEVGYAITECILLAYVDRTKPEIRKYPLESEAPSKECFKGQRDVYYCGEWVKYNTWEMDLLKAGNRVKGPSVIEHTMTTVVIPPHKMIDVDEHLVLWFKDQPGTVKKEKKRKKK